MAAGHQRPGRVARSTYTGHAPNQITQIILHGLDTAHWVTFSYLGEGTYPNRAIGSYYIQTNKNSTLKKKNPRKLGYSINTTPKSFIARTYSRHYKVYITLSSQRSYALVTYGS